MVRVDFFKPNGKWYTTEAIKWSGEYASPSNIYRQFGIALRDSLGDRLHDMVAVCLEPYHENAFPLMGRVAALIALGNGDSTIEYTL